MQLITPGNGDNMGLDLSLASNLASPTGLGIDIPLNKKPKNVPAEKEGDPEVILAGT